MRFVNYYRAFENYLPTLLMATGAAKKILNNIHKYVQGKYTNKKQNGTFKRHDSNNWNKYKFLKVVGFKF